MTPESLTGANLAFIGDAYYELFIREYVLNKGITQQYRLHDICVQYVSRTAQRNIAKEIYDELTDLEKEIFKRGRNYQYKFKTEEYVQASGLEAVIGYLYLKKENNRLSYVCSKAVEIIERNQL